MSGLFATRSPIADQCARAGCTESATWQVRWRNPKLHAADRVKIWLACSDHREYLSEFVNARGFLIETVAFEGVE